MSENDLRRGEQKAILTMFRLSGLDDKKMVYKQIFFRDAVPTDEYFPQFMNRTARKIESQLKAPVIPIVDGQRPRFIVDISSETSKIMSIEIVHESGLKTGLLVEDKLLEFNVKHADPLEKELTCRMLERGFSNALSRNGRYWRIGLSTFYELKPINHQEIRDRVDAYRGFSFRVLVLGDGEYYLSLDLSTRYVGRKPLSKYFDKERETYLKLHLENNSHKKRSNFLRDNGKVKFLCTFSGYAGKNAEDYLIEGLNQTVLEYYKDKYPHLYVAPDDEVVFVNNGTPVPSSRLFPIFKTDSNWVKRCSVKPQVNPAERLTYLQKIISATPSFLLSEVVVAINNNPYISRLERSPIPKLTFGGGSVLDPNAKDSNEETSPYNILAKYNSKKIDFLYEHGPYVRTPLPPIILLYPNNIKRDERDIFERLVCGEVEVLTHNKTEFYQMRPYNETNSTKAEFDITSIVEDSSQGQTLFILILPSPFEGALHDSMKRYLKSTFYQFLRESTFKEIINFSDERKNAKLQNLVLALLKETGTRLWGLEDGLNYSRYVGIDLLFGNIGVCLIGGEKAESIEVRFDNNILKGRMKEAIPKSRMKNIVSSALRDDFLNNVGNSPSLIVHRDGKWSKSESDGLKEALEIIEAEKKIEVKFGVVEIHKQHFPVRLMMSSNGDGKKAINPEPGSYVKLDSNRAIMVNTGSIGRWNARNGRTASPILVELKEHSDSITLDMVLEDIYRLTTLNWSAPNINLRLPISIDWLDDSLRNEWDNLENEE